MRKVTVKMVPYGPLETRKPYPAVVFHIEKKGREKSLQVRLRILDPSQDGRVQEVALPLPVFPDGRAAQFLRACGAKPEIGHEVPIEVAFGKQVLLVVGAKRLSANKVKQSRSLRRYWYYAGRCSDTREVFGSERRA